jgi:quercetin dioxygenase-like cupin family protein
MRALVAHVDEYDVIAGRRGFITFRDTGLKSASEGRASAVLIEMNEGQSQSTGWHYHLCDMQILYILQGWSDIEIEDGTNSRLEAGDVLFLPGGTKHNETRTSDDLRALEITLPANMGTVPCPEFSPSPQALGESAAG